MMASRGMAFGFSPHCPLGSRRTAQARQTKRAVLFVQLCTTKTEGVAPSRFCLQPALQSLRTYGAVVLVAPGRATCMPQGPQGRLPLRIFLSENGGGGTLPGAPHVSVTTSNSRDQPLLDRALAKVRHASLRDECMLINAQVACFSAKTTKKIGRSFKIFPYNINVCVSSFEIMI